LQCQPQAELLHVAVAFAGDVHWWPHPPQLLGSVASFTHAPLQAASGALQDQPQVELLHVAVAPAGAVHLLPHPPQLFGSAVSFTQAPPQGDPLLQV
jgi:hypothetical protein